MGDWLAVREIELGDLLPEDIPPSLPVDNPLPIPKPLAPNSVPSVPNAVPITPIFFPVSGFKFFVIYRQPSNRAISKN